MKERNHTIDILKGLAVFLVVYDHIWHVTGIHFAPFHRYICAFYMPIFPFASGLLTYGRTNESFFAYFAKKCRAIMKPYTVFFLMYLALGAVFTAILFHKAFVPKLEWLWAYLFSGNLLSEFSHKTGGAEINVLWFFETMFFAYLIFWFISKLRGFWLVLVTLFMGAGAVVLQYVFRSTDYIWTTPFNFKVIPLFVFYMCVGALFKEYFTGKVNKIAKVVISLILLIAAIGLIAHFRNVGIITRIKAPYVPVSVLWLIGLYGIFSAIGRIKLIEYLGRHSLYIYGLHMIFFNILAVRFKMIGYATDSLPIKLCIIVGSVLACCVCFEIYERVKFKLTGK
ncbi:MAG: acyltransferase family protein [Abditibacteriota bacterium]|nr:acyltransferase family protein [Abditibacteriota bacterium]